MLGAIFDRRPVALPAGCSGVSASSRTPLVVPENSPRRARASPGGEGRAAPGYRPGLSGALGSWLRRSLLAARIEPRQARSQGGYACCRTSSRQVAATVARCCGRNRAASRMRREELGAQPTSAPSSRGRTADGRPSPRALVHGAWYLSAEWSAVAGAATTPVRQPLRRSRRPSRTSSAGVPRAGRRRATSVPPGSRRPSDRARVPLMLTA